jgi:drug/metabolite transporter (DMT)-like permease
MIWLLLSIILNTYVGIVFKIFHRFGISNLQAIVINYFICVVTGSIYLGFHPFTLHYFQKDYFWFAIVQGFFFFIVFHWISKSTILLGVSATQVSNKLSLVIPVIMAYFLFQDSIGVIKIIGVVLAGVAVFLTSQKNEKNTASQSMQNWILPLLIFIGSGMLDTLTSYIQHHYFTTATDSNIYIIFCFASGAFFSSIYLMYRLVLKQEIFQSKSIIGGICLGVPNFFSIYTFVKALESNYMQASALVPVNNIGVVFASAICALLFFKEHLNQKNKIGLVIALMAIACIIIGDAK